MAYDCSSRVWLTYWGCCTTLWSSLFLYKEIPKNQKVHCLLKKCLKLSKYWFISLVTDWLKAVARVRYIFLWLYATEWDCYTAFIHLPFMWEASSAVTQFSWTWLGLSRKKGMGGVGGNLDPGEVQTSDVLQVIECVFSFGLWGFLFWGGFFGLLPCSCLFSDCFEISFLSFLSRAIEMFNSFLFTIIGVTKWCCSCLACCRS